MSGSIALGLGLGGQVGLWQTDAQIASVGQAVVPAHVCVREQLAAAQAQADAIAAALGEAEGGVSQQIAREQELRRSIAELEAKCAYMMLYISYLMFHI